MNKYLIDYQLEDEEPNHTVISANNIEDLATALRNHIFHEGVDFGLDKVEAHNRTLSVTVLDYKLI